MRAHGRSKAGPIQNARGNSSGSVDSLWCLFRPHAKPRVSSIHLRSIPQPCPCVSSPALGCSVSDFLACMGTKGGNDSLAGSSRTHEARWCFCPWFRPQSRWWVLAQWACGILRCRSRISRFEMFKCCMALGSVSLLPRCKHVGNVGCGCSPLSSHRPCCNDTPCVFLLQLPLSLLKTAVGQPMVRGCR